MKLKHIVDELLNVEGVDRQEALEMEAEFCVLSKKTDDTSILLLLGAYEYDGRVFIDIGTTEDDERMLSKIS